MQSSRNVYNSFERPEMVLAYWNSSAAYMCMRVKPSTFLSTVLLLHFGNTLVLGWIELHQLTGTCYSFFPRRVLQQLCVNVLTRQLHISHYRSTDETILHRSMDVATLESFFLHAEWYPEWIPNLYLQHMRIFLCVVHTDVCEFDVQILVNWMEGAANAEMRKR